MARISSLLRVVVEYLCQSLPYCLSISHSVLQLLVFEVLGDVVGGTGFGKKYKTPEILVCLFLHPLSKDVERRDAIGAQNKGRLGLTMKHAEEILLQSERRKRTL